MRILWKIGGVFLSLSLIFMPEVAQAKSKKTVGHEVSKSVVKSKGSKHHAQKNGHKWKNHVKRSFTKMSYSYGPRVYVENIEPNREIYKYAIGLLGTRYKFGGESINGIDCSSFVQNVFELAGYKMPRTAREQARYGYFVRKEDIKPGDLLFFATYASFPSHVGIYIGDGKMIHASSRGNKIEVSSINQDYYQKRFLFAKRIPANIKYLESIKDVEEYMEEGEFLLGNMKESSRPKRDTESDPIARIIKEKNGN